MIGNIDPNQRQVTIVGAGIAGLLAAYYFSKNKYRVSIYEEKERCGGLIRTVQSPRGISESAAHSLLGTPAVLQLFEELSVRLIPVNPDSKARWIWRNAEMRRFPLQPVEMIQTVFRFLAQNKIDQETCTIEEWALARLGRPALEYLVNPFLRGIYAARPSELSWSAVFPSDRKKSRGKMVVPEFGMEQWVTALENHLRKNTPTQFFMKTRFSLENASPHSQIVLCTPARQAAEVLRTSSTELSNSLHKIQYAPLISATVFAKKSHFKKIPKGVGVLIPELESSRQCLGILFSSSSFPGRALLSDEISVSIILGGTSRPDLISFGESEIQNLILSEIQEMLSFKGGISDCEFQIHRWPSAIPIYNFDLKNLRAVAQSTWCARPGKILFGNYTGQISIRGMIETMDSKFRSERFPIPFSCES